MDKVYIELKVKIILKKDNDIEVSDVIDELEYDFSDTTGKANVEDMEILDYEITDAK